MYLYSQTIQGLGELNPDRSAAQYDHRRRQFIQLKERLIGEVRDIGKSFYRRDERRRAGRDNYSGRAYQRFSDLYRRPVEKAGVPLQELYVHFCERFWAFVGIDRFPHVMDVRHSLLCIRRVYRNVLRRDMAEICLVNERLAGNTPRPRAFASRQIPVHQQDIPSESRSSDRCGYSTGSRADDQDILFFHGDSFTRSVK